MRQSELMRQSFQGSFDICPRRAWYSRQPHPYVTSDAAARGTGYHAGLEHHYSELMNGVIAPPGDVIDAAIAGFHAEVARAEAGGGYKTDTTTAECEDQIRLMLNTYFLERHDWPADEYEVLGVEVQFDLDWLDPDLLVPWMRAWRMGGTIDLVLKHRQLGFILPVDHKTTGRMWPADKNTTRKLPQAAWYGLALETMGYPNVGVFNFDLMTIAGRFKRIPVSLTDKDIVINRFIETARTADILDAAGLPWPANTSSVLCSEKYCDHWATCLYGGYGGTT